MCTIAQQAARTLCASALMVFPLPSQGEVPDCPSLAGELLSAEDAITNFYLTDAEESLLGAVRALGCGPRVRTDDLARLWNAHGMIAHYQDDPRRAARAFRAARALAPEVWHADYGAKARVVWEAATAPPADDAPPEAPRATVTVELRNLAADEWVSLDGAAVEPPVTAAPGLHVLQVGHGDVSRFARVVDLIVGEPVTLVVPNAPASAEGADATPPTIEETTTPLVDPPPPVAITPPVVAPVALGPRPIPKFAQGYVAPLHRDHGRFYLDATGQPLALRKDLLPIARYDLDGRRARRRFRRNTLDQITATTLAIAGAYGTYLFAWDHTTGHVFEARGYRNAGQAGLAGAATITATSLLWEALLVRGRPKRRAEIHEAAERVIRGEAL